MSKGNGSGERGFVPKLPEGIDPELGMVVFDQLVSGLHRAEPLTPMSVKRQVAQGLVGDMQPLDALRTEVEDAPLGTLWGISVSMPTRLVGGLTETALITAHVRLSECKTLNDVIATASCMALLNDPHVRGLLAMLGCKLVIRRPRVEGEDTNEEERS